MKKENRRFVDISKGSVIKIGDRVVFSSAQRYFGDGYVMPIVQLDVNGEELLSFEEGYHNLLSWLKSGGY